MHCRDSEIYCLLLVLKTKIEMDEINIILNSTIGKIRLNIFIPGALSKILTEQFTPWGFPNGIHHLGWLE